MKLTIVLKLTDSKCFTILTLQSYVNELILRIIEENRYHYVYSQICPSS